MYVARSKVQISVCGDKYCATQGNMESTTPNVHNPYSTGGFVERGNSNLRSGLFIFSSFLQLTFVHVL